MQADSHLVLTGALDSGTQVDGALVNGANASSLNSLSNSLSLDGTEQAAVSASLVCNDNRLSSQGRSNCLSLFQRSLSTSRTSGADGLNLLLATLGPGHGEAAGQQVVTCVTVLNGDNIASCTEAGNFLSQNDLSHVTVSPSL